MSDEIIQPMPTSPSGIYHLMRGESVVYVGQSSNVFARIASWAATRSIDFDGYRFFFCDVADLNDHEREHIAHYLPDHNIAGNMQAFLPHAREWLAPRYTDAELAAIIEDAGLDDLMCSYSVCSWTRVAASRVEILALVDTNRFPAPVAQKRNGKWLYWDRADIVTWLRAGRRWPQRNPAEGTRDAAHP